LLGRVRKVKKENPDWGEIPLESKNGARRPGTTAVLEYQEEEKRLMRETLKKDEKGCKIVKAASTT